MMEERLQDIGLSNPRLPFRLLIQFSDGVNDGVGGERHFDDSIFPIEDFAEFLITGTAHANHDRTGSRTLKIAMPELVLSTGFFRSVKFAGAHNEVPAPFSQIRQQGAMFVEIVGLQSVNCVVNVEFPVLFCHLHQGLMYCWGPSTDTQDINVPFWRVWIRTETKCVYGSGEKVPLAVYDSLKRFIVIEYENYIIELA